MAPAAAANLVVSIPPPSTVTAGTGFGLAIAAEDPYGNLATGFTGSVTVTLANNPGTGILNGGPVTVAATSGVANFHAYLDSGHGRRGLHHPGSQLRSDAGDHARHHRHGNEPGERATPAQLAFAVERVTVNENAGEASIQVVRSGGYQGAVSVAVATAGGTAVAGVNYTPINQVLNFAAGQDSQTITIPVKDDGVVTADLMSTSS